MWISLHQVLDLLEAYIWFNIGQPFIHRGLFRTLLSLHSKMQCPLQIEHWKYFVVLWCCHISHMYLQVCYWLRSLSKIPSQWLPCVFDVAYLQLLNLHMLSRWKLRLQYLELDSPTTLCANTFVIPGLPLWCHYV